MSAPTAAERLEAAERAASRLEAALRRIGPQDPFPPALAALFAAPFPRFDDIPLDPGARGRLAAVIDRVDAVRNEVAARQRRVAGRLLAVSGALHHQSAAGATIDRAL
ncbi:MAG TPA: hypothetical protein VFN60_02675 [Acidimicrobiales bacterium]|nr:hypothetical protein [Acidimicrobiales bacterium]